jgi:hypothetical protein
MMAENVRLVDISNRNAAAVIEADRDRRAAVEALESARRKLDVNSRAARIAESQIEAGAPEDDGPVAPVLEKP